MTRLHPAILTDMANNPDDPLKWFIAVGDNFAWGRSDKSESEAIRRMNRNGYQGVKAKKFAVYKCTANTTLSEMGQLTRPADDPPAVKIRQVGY